MSRERECVVYHLYIKRCTAVSSQALLYECRGILLATGNQANGLFFFQTTKPRRKCSCGASPVFLLQKYTQNLKFVVPLDTIFISLNEKVFICHSWLAI